MKLKLSLSIVLALLLPVFVNLLAAHSIGLVFPGIWPFQAPPMLDTTTKVTCDSPKTYTGAEITPCTATVTDGTGWTGSASITYTNDINVGTGNAEADFPGDATHNSSTDSTTFSITPAASTVTLDCPNVVYNGSSQTCTAEATGANGLLVTGLAVTYTGDTTNVGTVTAKASYAGDANHSSDDGSATFQITKGTPVCTINQYDVFYNGSTQTASGTCAGNHGDALAAPDLSKTQHKDAGTYAGDPWSFSDTTGNYIDINGTVTDTIEQIAADCSSIAGYSVDYDGSSHTASGSCNGISGNLSGLDLSATTHIDAGTYTDAWTFKNANYISQSGNLTDIIGTVAADCSSIVGFNGVYDGAAHGANGHCQIANGKVLDGLNLGAQFTDVPGGTAYYTLTNTNITGSPIIVDVPIVITQAASSVKFTCPTSVVYNGTAQSPCSAEAIGPGGLDVTGLTVTYSANTVVGTATVNATYTPDPVADPNHTGSSGSTTFQINAATPDCSSVVAYNVVYNAAPYTAKGACLDVNSQELAGLDLSKTAHTEAGAYDDAWTFTDQTGNYSNAGGSLHDVIAKADATCTPPTPYNVTYDGTSHTGTGAICIGVGGVTLNGLVVTNTTHTAAGDYLNDAWSFGNNADYNDQSGTIHDVISQATASCTINNYTVTYNALTHIATGTCTGVPADGTLLNSLNLGLTSHTEAGIYPDTWTFSNGNYVGQTGNITDTISPATATCTATGYTATYDTLAHTASVTCKGVGGVNIPTVINVNGTLHTYAGTYNGDAWSFSNNDYLPQSGTVNDVINKATPKCAVTFYTSTYNGNPHLATGSCTGVGNVTLVGLDVTHTNHTAVGVYNTDYWFFTDLTTNYTNIANTTITDTITRAAPTCVVTPYNIPWDGLSHQPTVTCTGAKGENLTTVTLPAAHTAPAVYADTWSLVESTGNYTNQLNQPVTDTINFLPATCTVTPYNIVFDNLTHLPTYSCAKPDGTALSGALTGVTAHTNIGSYPDAWSFTDSTNIYKASGSITDVITAAPSVTTITCPVSVVYTGVALTPCTAKTTGIGGLNVTDTLTNYTNNTNVSPAPGASVNFTYPATGNYLASIAPTASFLITQMPTTTTVTCPASVHYTGVAQKPCTATVMGGSPSANVPGGVAALIWTYNNNTTAGSTASVTAAYPGDANHVASGGSGSFTITNPVVVCTVTPYSVTYDGNPHTATGTCITTDGVDYSSGLSLAGSTQTNYGTYPFTWTFHDTIDALYGDQSGSISDSIARAPVPAGCNAGFLTWYNGNYTGTPHGGPTVTNCKGVKGEDLSYLLKYQNIIGGGYINVTGGSLIQWWFNQGYTNPNYETAGDYGIVVIHAAPAGTSVHCNISGVTVPYDGQPHGPSGTCTGANNEDLTSYTSYSNPKTYTNVPGGSVTWTMTDANYQPSTVTGTVQINITNIATTTTVSCPVSVSYTGAAQTPCTASVKDNTTGLQIQTVPVTYTTNTNVGTATASAAYAGNANYQKSNGSATFQITPVNATCTVAGYTVPYNGAAHLASGSCKGVGNVTLPASDLNLLGTSHIDFGTYSDTWSFSDPLGNYNPTNGSVTDSITAIQPTCTVSGYTVKYDGNAHLATGSCKGLAGVTLTSLDLSGTSHIDAGTYNGDTWVFNSSNPDYLNANGTVNDSIGKIDATCTVTGYNVKYDGAAHTASGTCTGAGKDVSSGLILTGTSHTDAGNYSDSWSFADTTGDFNNTSGTVTDIITPADAIIKVNGYTGVYDGNAHGATGTASGLNGEDLTGLLNLGASFTDVPGGTATWNFAGNNDYNAATGSADIVITPAIPQCSVKGYNVPFDNTSHSATGTCTGLLGEDLSTSLDLGGTAHTNAGSYADTWTFTTSHNDYKSTSGSVNDTISKVDAACTVTGYTVDYDGNAHTATGTCSGAGLDLSSSLVLTGTTHTNAGTYTDSWSFSETSGNFNGTGGTVTDKINPIDTTCTVTGYAVPYDGNAHSATGSCTGAGTTGLNLGGTSHTDVGSWSDSWNFSDPNGNYNDTNGTVNDSISKADAVITVNGYSGVYDGLPHGATGTATGVQGENLAALLHLGATFTNVPGGTADWTFDGNLDYNATSGSVEIVITPFTPNCSVTPYDVHHDGLAHVATGACYGVNGLTLAGLDLTQTSHINVGTYTDPWTFTDTNKNYGDASGTVVDNISKIDPVCVINGYNVPYNGSAHTATGTCTGAGGAALNGLDLSGTSHTNPGDYSDTWKFTDTTGNYNDATDTVADSIGKATPTCTVTPYNVNYDGSAHTASGSCSGSSGQISSGLDLNATTHTNAGSYTDTWTFTDASGFYTDATGTVSDSIAKVDTICTVTGYTLPYDGSAHTASGSCTGGAIGLNLNGTSHTEVGTYNDAWSFHDANGNFNDSNGSVNDSITKADATFNIIGYTGVFDGKSHGASATVTGAKGEDLSGLLHVGAGFTNVPGGTVVWTFDGNNDYRSNSGSVAIVITQADPTCTVTPYDVPLDGLAHTATGSCTGAGNLPLAGLDLTKTTHNSIGTFTDPWTFTDTTGNYANTNGTVQDKITKVDPKCVVTGYSVAFDGSAHTATGTCTGANGAVLSGLDLTSTSHTNPGSYTDSWTFTDSTGSYNSASGTVSDSIGKADPTCVVKAYTVPYDGSAHTATGTCSAADGSALSGLDLGGTSHTDVGSYSDSWTFTDSSGNYNNAAGTLSDSIGKGTAKCTVTPYTVAYDNTTHSATGSCTDASGAALSGLNLSGTSHSLTGDYPSDAWTFTDSTGNYNNANGTVHDSITRTNPTCTVTPYNVTFDGVPHSATGTCTGIAGETLAGLSLTGTTHTNPGDFATDTWTFTDNVTGNYNTISGTVHDVIAKADAICVVTPYDVTFTGVAHTATGTCSGVGGVALTGLVLTGTSHTGAGDYPADTWTFTNTSLNYNNATGTVHDVIARASVTCVVTPYSLPFDGISHTASGYCMGIGGVNVAGIDLSGSTHTNAADYPDDTWTFTDANGNYAVTNGNVHDTITTVAATCNVTPYNLPYDNSAHTASGSCTGIGGVALTGLDLGSTTHTDAGDYPNDAWVFANTNYTNANGIVHDVIAPVKATCSVSGYSGSYDGKAHGASGSCSLAGGVKVSGLTLGDSFTNVPGGTAYWNFANPNVAPSLSGNVSISISLDKTNVVIMCPAKATYTGSALTPCTAKATSAGGLNQTLDVSYSNNTDLGTATASASYAGDGNHTSDSGTASFIITNEIVDTPTSAALASVPQVNPNGAPVAANHKGEIGLGVDLKAAVLAAALTINAPTATPQPKPTSTKAVVSSALGGKTQSQAGKPKSNFWATYSGLFGCLGTGFLGMLIFFMFKRRKDDDSEEGAPENNQ